ncbi:MAG: DUF5686 family protein [Mediterranea sp.]|nr:DUF5686 family protein [Mediterranea sp.]
MKRILILHILFLAASPILPAGKNGRDALQRTHHRTAQADSIVDNAIGNAPRYASMTGGYHADLYVKGRVYIRRKNLLVRFVPSLFRLRKDVKDYLVETCSELHFTAPNIYDRKVKAVYGNAGKYRGVEGDVLDYLGVNIYAPFLLHSKLLSPLAPAARKHYSYRIDTVTVQGGRRSYRIAFTPRNKSYQLVEGHMVISDSTWSVREMQFSGRSEYQRFDNRIEMGDAGTGREFLPQRYELNTTFNFMGNTIDGSYTAVPSYHSITLKSGDDDDEGFFALRAKSKYDLTEAYNLQNDTAQYRTDSLTLDSLRPIPLSPDEQRVYRNYSLDRDTLPEKKDSWAHRFREQMGDMLISSYTVDLNTIGSVKCSPLINPFLVSFSKRDGYSYRQDFKYSRLFDNDRLLRMATRIGYNFKHHEFYWRITGDYDYLPRKGASLHLRVGNGNRIYTSKVLDEIKQTAGTSLDFDKIHLDYFRDFYIDLSHRVEVTNGVHLNAGFSTHRRTAVRKSDFTSVESSRDPAEELTDIFRNEYRSFAARIALSWTPGQYYYMNGKRKINLHSKLPTFSVDWERGLKGVFKSTGIYERVELDMQHYISLGLMQTLYYRAGAGMFTDQKQLFFVDFVNFSRNNLPLGWNDEIGGVFQLLDRRWYNASLKYIRANITYEAPFLIMPHLLKRTPNVLNERLYIGVLAMPYLKPYIEIGYGIGTHIFDLGLFVSNTNGKFTDAGFKLTFELFNR